MENTACDYPHWEKSWVSQSDENVAENRKISDENAAENNKNSQFRSDELTESENEERFHSKTNKG